jgi:hypothetical protein
MGENYVNLYDMAQSVTDWLRTGRPGFSSHQEKAFVFSAVTVRSVVELTPYSVGADVSTGRAGK